MTDGPAPWWRFSTAANLAFGLGSSRFVAEAAASLGRRVVLCTDANLVRAGVVQPLAERFEREQGVELLIFDEGAPEISVAAAERCAEKVRGFEPDVIVGLGGGSNLDLAKTLAVRLAYDRPIARWQSEGTPASGLPIVALPTTAGTGSEVTSVAVLTDEDRHVKVGLTSRAFLPSAVVVDPLLTLSCPPRVTAHSGMDALSHAVEAFTAISYTDRPPVELKAGGFIGKNPLSDTLALRATELIGASLVAAVEDGSDVSARADMALGSLLAGMAFSSAGTAIVHALQYPVGASTGTAHGHGNALLLPAVLRFNLPVRERELAALARALGVRDPDETQAARRLPDVVRDLARRVGIEPGLSSIGMQRADLPAAASAAAEIRRLTDNNPRPVGVEELLGVLEDAL